MGTWLAQVIVWVELTKEQKAYYRAIYENRIGVLLAGNKASNVPQVRAARRQNKAS